jgi:methylenetetrahydrofolate dehydrogenase (NADP+)/methenyltetrahydrofolate cyclohydrolase
MSALLLNGNTLANTIRKSFLLRIAAFQRRQSRSPHLAILGGARDAASKAYLQSRLKTCRQWGLEATTYSLQIPGNPTQAFKLLSQLSENERIDAIILDLPLPRGLNGEALASVIPPGKVAEGITPANYGRLFKARSWKELESLSIIAPPTALACVLLVKATRKPIMGRHAAILGRSVIAGRPTAHLLSLLDATVTLCHSKTQDIEEEISRAEIVVSAMGKPGLVRGAWLKKGCVVIDAGTSMMGGTLRGDTDYEETVKIASYLTPVPGGVGPVTTAMLLANTVRLAESRAGKSQPYAI